MKTAFNVTTGASGGYLVPDPLFTQIVAKRSLMSWVRQAPVSIFQTSADHVLVPYEDTSHTALVSTAEGVAYDENEGTIGQKDLALTKYTKLVKVSEEFLMDTNSNWEAWIASVLGRTEALVENTVATANVLDGSGATAATAAATSTSVTAAELARLIGSVGAGYNVPSECGFLAKNVNKWFIKGLASYGFQFISTPTAPDFYGYPCYVSDDMPAMTTGLYATVFGNWTMFGVAEKNGLTVRRNDALYMATGQVGIFANKYFACDVLQSEAIYKMAQA
jgi:HK97 family phage major capsid protein